MSIETDRPLRPWQKECIQAALVKYRSGKGHFLCMATPGAGKTKMASSLASQLFEMNAIDLVICFTPSVTVAHDFRIELEATAKRCFDGKLGSNGMCMTYAAMLYCDEDFWNLFKRFRILAIFDEIHHCASSEMGSGNAWGSEISQKIQDHATYTLALSGTPWRSDRIPISLLAYSDQSMVVPDYIYSLSNAIQDGVCKIPTVTLIDNANIVIRSSENEEEYSSIGDVLVEKAASYTDFLLSNEVLESCLDIANKKLQELRLFSNDVAGLVVCSSIAHAAQVHQVLRSVTGINATLVTSRDGNAQAIIKRFRNGVEPWIISVGMISEGTNIPRLSVCLHLSRILTELHFRQVLGRIVRSHRNRLERAFLFVPANPQLESHANRLNEELPESTSLIQIGTKDSNNRQKHVPRDRWQDPGYRLDWRTFPDSGGPEDHIDGETDLSSGYRVSLDFQGIFSVRELLFAGIAT